MYLSELVNSYPLLVAYKNKDFAEFINLLNYAYEYVVEKIKLHPCVVSVEFTGSVQLLGTIHHDEFGNEIKFKEIIDIIAESYNEYCLDELETFVTLSNIAYSPLEPSGAIYKYANVMHAPTSSIVNIVAYIYPYIAITDDTANTYVINKDFYTDNAASMKVSPTLCFALIAKLHAIISLKNSNISSSAAYEDLCLKYINLYNSFQKEDAPKSFTIVSEVTPYAL